MRYLRLGITLIVISVFALLILDFLPGPWVSNTRYVNSTISYVILGITFYVATHLLELPYLEYFRLPRFHFETGIALRIASMFIVLEITGSDNVHLKPTIALRGLIFLLVLGFGEEMVSRALVFGALRKFGQWRAIVISSFLFGLLHINVYIGSHWDSWLAYWHVMDTFAWAIFTCTLMIVTRSIWVAVIFHALSDWSIVFDKATPTSSTVEKYNPSLWERITSPFFNGLIYVLMASLLLWVNRGTVPRWMMRLAIKFKLVETKYEQGVLLA